MRRARLAGAILLAAAVAAAVAVSPIARPRCIEVRGPGTLTIKLSDLTRGVGFFCYRDSAGERVRFVLARGDDGKVQSVFDACRQCYKFHKGYTVSGGNLICRLCGTRYKISEMHAGKASCVPLGLPAEGKGDLITVKVADLERAVSLF